ncbi:MAG: hypothetical protein RL318_27 [Fibrobacterota bacterium]|jgi:hypothetical protein
MRIPASIRSLGGVLCILLAQIACAQDLPQDASVDSLVPDPSLALSPEEAQALGMDGQSAQSSVDSIRPVLEIAVRGVDPQVARFVEHLLPVHRGEKLSRAELEALLLSFNERMAGRTDFFEACVAMVQPWQEGFRILVEARSRTFGSYGGGNAFGYFGHHNCTGVGDQWGLWAGVNRIGGHRDLALRPGLFVGGLLQYQTPMESSAPDHGLQHFRSAITLRQILSPVHAWDLEAGVWAVRDSEGKLPGKAQLSLYARPAWEIDGSWAKERLGLGGVIRAELMVGQNLSKDPAFATAGLHSVWRTAAWGRASALMVGDAGMVVDRPGFLPGMSGGFGVWQAQSVDPALERSATISMQPRFSLWRRDLWFTGLDAGIHGLLEAYAAKGEMVHRGLVHGAGLHFTFRAPVGVDFLITSAWSAGRFLGVRLVTERDF